MLKVHNVDKIEELANYHERTFVSWTAEVYSFGKIIRSYGYYPSFLPLAVSTDHSPAQASLPFTTELRSPFPTQFYHSERLVNEFKKLNTKRCYSMKSPFVIFRRKNKIQQHSDSKGTIAFPFHSTPCCDVFTDVQKYIECLKALPVDYHPIDICIYFHDVKTKLHTPFIEAGFNVVTAGHFHDPLFVDRFYQILSKYKYSTSNYPMSCLFYSVEMGIPHFIYGNPPFALKNNLDIYLPSNVHLYSDFRPRDYFLTNLFTGPTKSITPLQLEEVNKELGLTTGISRLKMSLLLYYSFLRYFGPYYLKKLFDRK